MSALSIRAKVIAVIAFMLIAMSGMGLPGDPQHAGH